MSTPVHSAGRKFKFIGFLLISVGIFVSMFAGAQSAGSSTQGFIGFAMIGFGFLTFLIGRFQD